MDDYYIISCQQINHRGGGFLIDIRFRDDGYWLRRQEREDIVDWELFYRLRLDERQPMTSRQVPVATLAEIVAGLQQVTVPALPAVGGGFDGTDFTLAIQRSRLDGAVNLFRCQHVVRGDILANAIRSIAVIVNGQHVVFK